jgi:hypothetical protein
VGLHQGTRALTLIDPIVTQEIGLFRADGEIVMPMANAFVTMVKKLNESGELRTRFSPEFSDGPRAGIENNRPAKSERIRSKSASLAPQRPL